MPTIAEKWVQEGMERGMERGREEGMEKEKITITEKMIERGMSNQEIRAITGLDIDRIEGMRGKM